MSDRERIPGALVVVAIVFAGLAWMLVQRLGGTIAGAATHEPRALEAAWPDMRIVINACSVSELTALPGIGPGLAERQVEDRAQVLLELTRDGALDRPVAGVVRAHC